MADGRNFLLAHKRCFVYDFLGKDIAGY